MNSFERFRNKQHRRVAANDHYNSQFIFNAYNSALITNNEVEVAAAVVSKQEKDQGYIYTHAPDYLPIGSVWETKGLHWLIVEEIINIKDTDYHKYFALLCNVDLGITWGYFKSRLGIRNEQDTALESTQEPQITLPSNYLQYQDKIVLDGRAWIVQEYDSISNPGVTVYSLQTSTISKEETQDLRNYIVDVVRAKPEVLEEDEHFGPTPEQEEPYYDDRIAVAHNKDIKVSTENGYLKYVGNIKVLSRTAEQIIFTLPFGVEQAIVTVKKDGEEKVYLYLGVD